MSWILLQVDHDEVMGFSGAATSQEIERAENIAREHTANNIDIIAVPYQTALAANELRDAAHEILNYIDSPSRPHYKDNTIGMGHPALDKLRKALKVAQIGG